ncbi:CapA family protein [Streptomyces specialis]|uniref:CapA family protein n=1 Tax=Streptomyces specialis TaxID=498367 RepID=UPI00073E97E9|nr:CapA family protein [Streptomyces specialis]
MAVTTVLGAGDVFPDLPNGRELLAPLGDLLSRGDIVFGNCEGAYTDRPEPAPTHKHLSVAPSRHGDFLGDAGFTVMSLANNHAVDAGHRGLRDTMALLRAQGIAVSGAGENLAEATAPTVVTHGRTRVAFVSYCSVFPKGYEARGTRPGLAGLRVLTGYHEPDPNFWEPGIAPTITTTPHPDDLARLDASLAQARRLADVVVASFHWGYSSRLRDVRDYEPALARHAADAGADAVLCHHHHALRGIEVRDGAPIFYGLGTLVHHLRVTDGTRRANERRHGALSSMAEHDFLPYFPYREEARATGVAVLEIDGDTVVGAGLAAARIGAVGATVPLGAGDPRGAHVLDYLDTLNDHAGLDTEFARRDWHGWAYAAVPLNGGAA